MRRGYEWATAIGLLRTSALVAFKLERRTLVKGSMLAGQYKPPAAPIALLAALLGSIAIIDQPCVARALAATVERRIEAETVDSIVWRLTKGSFTLIDAKGAAFGERRRDNARPELLSEQTIVETLRDAHLTPEQAAGLWGFFADQDNTPLATLAIIKALVSASDTPQSREALWSELSGLSRAFEKNRRTDLRQQSLLGFFERNRDALRFCMPELREAQSAADDMIELMLKSRVFGADLDESVASVTERIPAAIARRIESDRELGRPVRWEYVAFESMVKWKDERLVPGGAKAPGELADFDGAGEAFVTIFNSLHALDEGFREVILRGLGPIELFNAVVAGEHELYRLGTSGYRDYLHVIIMRGIKESGSLEAFVARALPQRYGDEAAHAAGRRAMVFMRVVSSFGLLDQVLETVRDRERFIDSALASLGDPRTFEGNSAVMMEVLTAPSGSPTALAFKSALLDQLYRRYRAERSAAMVSVYGSMLSVYQTITGDRRDHEIDRAFAIDQAIFDVPFNRLFSADGKGGFAHRMLMRLDENDDAVQSYEAFTTLMKLRGASIRDERFFEVFRFAAPGRSIEIYINKPNASGVRQGVTDIADVLKGKRVETIIGRGHTSIISPLQADAKRVLGDRVKDVAAVFVGSCGGDASVHELIATFGSIPFFTTKSTGRQIINNAIIETYVGALMSLAPGDRLSMPDVLERAIARFRRPGVNEALRVDASLYQVNMTTVLTALLFDAHVRRHIQPDRYAARD